MRKISFTVAAATTFTAAAVGLAGIAVAAPTGGGNAGRRREGTPSEGYNVQINGSVTVPLSACALPACTAFPLDSADSGRPFTTVYVDVSCPVDD